MTSIPPRVSIIRGADICVSRGSMSLTFTVEEFREVAEKGIALCDTIDRRAPFARDRHLNDSSLSGGSRREAGSAVPDEEC